MSDQPQVRADDIVPLPPSVKRAADVANAAHAAVYGAAQPPEQPAPEAPPPPEQPAPEAPPPPEQPAPVELSRPEERSGVDSDSWKGRYYAMEGRYKQAQTAIGSLQEQMQELGDELIRVQRQGLAQPQAAHEPVHKRLTEEDVNVYGPELIDVMRRAALEAVTPELQALQQQTRQVTQQVSKKSVQDVYAKLTEAVPDWRAINNDQRFRDWCRKPDIYSGQVRGSLLNAALRAGDTPRVIAFFKGFLSEEIATGHSPDPSAPPPAPPAPRVPAAQLASMIAPGSAKPAPGQTGVPADKPVFTRQQIAEFYQAVRRGVYAGRDADKARDEAAIFSAQNEGRVR